MASGSWGFLEGRCLRMADYVRRRGPRSCSRLAGAEPMLRALRRTLVIAGAFVIVDAFVISGGLLAVFTALGALIGGVLRTLFALRRGEPTTARLRAARTGIYVAAGLLALGVIFANDHLVRQRADVVIAACRQYEAQHGRLPDRLDELVPAYLPAVPSAKYTLTFNTFWYMAYPGHHWLMWFTEPPFARIGLPAARQVYFFENSRWVYVD